MNYKVYNIKNAGKDNVYINKLRNYYGENIITNKGELDFYNTYINIKYKELINYNSLIIIVDIKTKKLLRILYFIPCKDLDKKEIDDFRYKTKDNKYCVCFDIPEHDDRYNFYEGYYNTYHKECPYIEYTEPNI